MARLQDNSQPAALGHASAIEIVGSIPNRRQIGKGWGRPVESSLSIAGKKQGMDLARVWEHNQRAIGFTQNGDSGKFGEHIFPGLATTRQKPGLVYEKRNFDQWPDGPTHCSRTLFGRPFHHPIY